MLWIIFILIALTFVLTVAIFIRLGNLEGKEEYDMATLAEVQAEVTAEQDVVKAAVALISGLASQVKNLTPDQAAIDKLANDIEAQKESLAAAVTANTPPAPAPAP